MRWISFLAALSACYEPELRDCAVTCTAPRECYAGQVCEHGYCANPGIVCGEIDSVDAVADTPNNTSEPDAGVSLCELGCLNGTCDGDVCVIDCTASGSCVTDIRCPINVACRVLCGDSSCTRPIICTSSPSCEVVCSGIGSCRDEVRCGTTPCDVTCSGENSCARRIKCKESCACDARCTGIGSCGEINECPLGDACRIGEGCTSQLAGCETCP